MTAPDPGFIEFSRSEDWWQEDTLTEALRAAEPTPHTNSNPPDWAIAMAEELGRQYAAVAKRRAASIPAIQHKAA